MGINKENLRWEDLPKDIQRKMLRRQARQVGWQCVDIFKRDICAQRCDKGFDWDGTIEGYSYWDKILNRKKIIHRELWI